MIYHCVVPSTLTVVFWTSYFNVKFFKQNLQVSCLDSHEIYIMDVLENFKLQDASFDMPRTHKSNEYAFELIKN